jgi:hypothetical protein
MLGRRNEIVMTIDPLREEARRRHEEVCAAAKNYSSGLREWILEEAAWLVAQFTRVAMSVAVVRGVHQLFRIGYASESAYQRAGDLWTHGHREDDRPPPIGGRRTARDHSAQRKAADNSIPAKTRMVPRALATSLPSKALTCTYIARS